jgi:hypothetical protein
MVTIREEMRHYLNRLNEAQVNKRQAQAILNFPYLCKRP